MNDFINEAAVCQDPRAMNHKVKVYYCMEMYSQAQGCRMMTD